MPVVVLGLGNTWTCVEPFQNATVAAKAGKQQKPRSFSILFSFELRKKITGGFSMPLLLVHKKVFLGKRKRLVSRAEDRRGKEACKLWNACGCSVFLSLPS